VHDANGIDGMQHLNAPVSFEAIRCPDGGRSAAAICSRCRDQKQPSKTRERDESPFTSCLELRARWLAQRLLMLWNFTLVLASD
jgi:hypothetical protein